VTGNGLHEIVDLVSVPKDKPNSTDMKTINRRDFLGNSVRIAVAASALPLYSYANDIKPEPDVKTKLALVGTGNRGTYSWGKSVIEAYKDSVEMVALCDINPKRMAASRAIMGIAAKTYEAKDFDLMLRETRPDMVIVTTTDCFHEKYIVRALELGCDVICEKPLQQRLISAVGSQRLKTGRERKSLWDSMPGTRTKPLR
jgi:hypothetical protein